MGAEHHALGRFGRGEARAEREAAANALGRRHDVGRHAILFVREQRAGPAIAALDLVEDQQQPALVACLAQAGQEFGRRGAQATLALYRLDEEAGVMVVDQCQRTVEVVELGIFETG